MTDKQEKECFCCKTVKNFTEFSKNSKYRDGRINKCKLCIKKDRKHRELHGAQIYKSSFKDGMKLCVTCNKTSRYKGRIGAWHPVSNFSPSEHTGNGYASACKDCSSGKNRVESVKEKEAKNTSSLVFILNQATKNLPSTQEGYYTYEY